MSDYGLLAPLDVPPAYIAVVERLRRSIALGMVAPGERLPPERTLAARLGVSRVTVREALRVLQGEGLIVTKRGGHGGAVVMPGTVSAEASGPEAEIRAHIEQIFEYRLAVEAMAARLAAERRTDDNLEALAACQDALVSSEGTGGFRRVDSTFHLAVADASRNRWLRQSIEDARAVAFGVLDERPFRVLLDSTAAGHARILDAIRAGRPDAAAAAMVEHLVTSRQEVLDTLFGSDHR
jgi:DNA-binding FadR family transcriptional regulator